MQKLRSEVVKWQNTQEKPATMKKTPNTKTQRQNFFAVLG